MACTVKVSNISAKATIREIMEFFSNSGQIESINLNSSDGDGGSQTAYVTFKDHDSLKNALLLSGSTILDKEVEVAAFSKPGTKEVVPESGNDPPEGGGSNPLQGSRPGAINGVQDTVRSMLSRGLSVGKDAMRRASSSADERSKTPVDGDPLRSMSQSQSQRSEGDVDEGTSKSKTDRGIKPKTNEDGKAGGGDVVSQALHESGLRGNNVRESVRNYYKHVCAVNEKLQIGQRTMSALASAQQGVASAGSAVAGNKFVAAGGGWVSSAFARMPLINKSSAAPSHSDGEGTSQQLTEMTSFPTHKSGQ